MRTLVLPILTIAMLLGCEQKAPAPPVDPAPAPVVEAAPAASTNADTMSAADISAKLVGTWRATDDEKSTVTITADGVWTDDYVMTPPVHAISAWRIFSGTEPPAGVTYTFTPSSNYLEVTGAAGAMYYELGEIGADAFDMFYTARGNMLAFSRVK